MQILTLQSKYLLFELDFIPTHNAALEMLLDKEK